MLSHMQAKGLSAGYNGEAVFRGLDLKIPEGSITTLIGSNGSGKSTILKTLCRIISPDSGAVYLDGEAIHRMPTKRVAQRLALLPQGAQAPAGITVGDLVEYGRFPYRSALSGLGEKDREIIQWALASTGMSSLEHREMERLSGGQQQRAIRFSAPWHWRRKPDCCFWMNPRPIWTSRTNWIYCTFCAASTGKMVLPL